MVAKRKCIHRSAGKISPDAISVLKQYYPQDQARHELRQVRSAFSLSKRLPNGARLL